MFSNTAIVYIIFFVSGCVGSLLYHPIYGLFTYLLVYFIHPGATWWGQSLYQMGFRHSLIAAAVLGIGMFIHSSKLKYQTFFNSQERILVLYLLIIWLSIPLGLGANYVESNVIKMTKITMVLLAASYVVIDIKKFDQLIWVFIIGSLYMGWIVQFAPNLSFSDGRLNTGIGGSDFNESNFLAFFLASLIPFIGVFFIKSSWKGKIVCIITAPLVINAIILCRSRGALLAIIMGAAAAVFFSIKGKRIVLMFFIIIGLLGSLYLMDTSFLTRMGTIETVTSEMDSSSSGRLRAWNVAISMFKDYPLGIGEGNFKLYVGNYDLDIAGKDTHNTYLRCLSEIGIQGFLILCLLIVNAFRILKKIAYSCSRITDPNIKTNFLWNIYAVRISLVISLVAGLTITQTYVEWFYWLLILPTFIEKSFEKQMYLTTT